MVNKRRQAGRRIEVAGSVFKKELTLAELCLQPRAVNILPCCGETSSYLVQDKGCLQHQVSFFLWHFLFSIRLLTMCATAIISDGLSDMDDMIVHSCW